LHPGEQYAVSAGLVVIAAFMFGISLIAFSMFRYLVMSVFLIFAVGFSVTLQTISCNTILQTIVHEEMRGRVMGFLAMAFMGMTPFENLLAGLIAGRIGAPNTLVISGVTCLAAGFFFYVRLPAIQKLVRPIYARMGIIRIPDDLR
jgi:MFS family permease